jgi:hypothetical protein
MLYPHVQPARNARTGSQTAHHAKPTAPMIMDEIGWWDYISASYTFSGAWADENGGRSP